jgi:hypothetical protein
LIWMKVSVNPMPGLIALAKITREFIPLLEADAIDSRTSC